MIVRQLFDAASSTYTYLLVDGGEAALVDPVREQIDRDLRLVEELGVRLRYTLDTHVHADHVTAAGTLRERTGCKTVAPRAGGPDCADVPVADGDTLAIGAATLHVLSTPGHTAGCVTYRLDAPGAIFTGDALLVRTCGRTDFQGGDAGRLFDAVHGKLFTLPDATIVYPGHDYRGFTSSTIGEEKRWNARLVGRTRDEFIRLMASLDLAMPKKIAEAVPANLACGRTEGTP